MAKTRTIPDYERPNWSCKIGNTTYEYAAGSTQSVPDAVADVIDNLNALKPEHYVEDKYGDLPAATSDKLGAMFMGAGVNDAAGNTPTADEFNALVASLRNAGVIAVEVEEG